MNYDSSLIIFLGIMGILFTLPPLLIIFYKLLFRLNCKKTLGKVLSREKKYDPETESYNLITTIEIYTYLGERYLLEYGIGYGIRYLPPVNSTVTIYYKINNPQKFQLANRGLWEVSGIFILTGLLMLAPYIFIELLNL
ncbi:MAG: hypothetical protein ACRCZE_01565 [Candidatus Altimarinota bacterium]